MIEIEKDRCIANDFKDGETVWMFERNGVWWVTDSEANLPPSDKAPISITVSCVDPVTNTIYFTTPLPDYVKVNNA
jgi:hypothetical protein